MLLQGFELLNLYIGNLAVIDGPDLGRWYIFDARNNVPRVGRVLMARGRDAIDVAITTTFGPNTLVSFKVWTDEVAST